MVKYLLIGILLIILIVLTTTTPGVGDLAGFSQEFVNFFSKFDFSGYGFLIGLGVSGTGALTYILIKKRIQEMTRKEIENSMKQAESKKEKLSGNIGQAISLIQKTAEKNNSTSDKPKKSLWDKTKSFFGSKKQNELIEDHFINKREKETFYNENYIMNEYLKIEKKLKKQVF
jgi:hypothetical protein